MRSRLRYMNSLNDIIERIREFKKPNNTFLIAIDGFGGSGKSTLAREIAACFNNVSIVQLDDFYAPKLKRADRARVVEQVIKPLKVNKKAKYQRFDWPSSSLAEWHEVEPGGIVIIEGVSTLHPDLGQEYDLTIWIAMSQEEAAERGIARDLNEYEVDTRDQWEREWMPQEKAYVASINPMHRADVIIRGDSTSR